MRIPALSFTRLFVAPLVLGSALLGSVGYAVPASADNLPKAATAAPRTLTTEFTFTASIASPPTGTGDLDLWVPIPSDSPYQKVRNVTVTAPVGYKITREPKYGNRMVFLQFQKPTAPIDVTVKFVVDRSEVKVLDGVSAAMAKDHSDKGLDKYLAADSKVPTGGRYAEIAHTVLGTGTEASATPRSEMRALFDHVIATMQYDYKHKSPELGEGDVAFVCDYKKGNCSDLHSYLISLARSLNIPAYLEFGFPISGVPVASPLPTEGKIGGYHCWTWYHDTQAGWVPVDAADGRRWLDANQPTVKDSLFGNLVLERSAVAVSRGRDLTLVPAQKAGPLNYFIYPYAEADGKPVTAAWTVQYHLLSSQTRAAALTGEQTRATMP